jgi:FdhD protein
MDQVTTNYPTTIVTPGEQNAWSERVLLETPIRIALNEDVVGSSMVMPTSLEEFAVGFLFGQGYLTHAGQVVETALCDEGLVTVYARVDEEDLPDAEDMIVTSGCGGTGRIARRFLEGPFPEPLEVRITIDQIGELIRGTLGMSSLQRETHCVHGCGFWSEGRFQAAFEDVGRHNAVDKVIGALLLERFPPGGAMYTTGRLTSDMVMKCARMGVPIVVSRTAPSSLGVDIALRAGMTLIAYARPGRLNVFCGLERVALQN